MKRPTPTRQDNFSFLLAGLFLLLVAAPVASELVDQSWKIELELTFSGLLIVGVWSLYGSRRWFFAGIVLVVVGVLSTAAAIVFHSELARWLTILSILIFLGMTGVAVLRQVLLRGKVDLNAIIGTVCVYLLLGVFWAVLYDLLASVVPGSFSGLERYDEQQWFWRLLYYSFVTLSTLGYGDITPANALSESMAYLEAIVGQFYIAVLVASLVGMYISGRESPRALTGEEHRDGKQASAKSLGGPDDAS